MPSSPTMWPAPTTTNQVFSSPSSSSMRCGHRPVALHVHALVEVAKLRVRAPGPERLGLDHREVAEAPGVVEARRDRAGLGLRLEHLREHARLDVERQRVEQRELELGRLEGDDRHVALGASHEAQVDAARGRETRLGEQVRGDHRHHQPRLEAADRLHGLAAAAQELAELLPGGRRQQLVEGLAFGQGGLLEHALHEAEGVAALGRGDVGLDHERLRGREGALDRRIETQVGCGGVHRAEQPGAGAGARAALDLPEHELAALAGRAGRARQRRAGRQQEQDQQARRAEPGGRHAR